MKRRRSRSAEEASSSGSEWLTTFNDLVTLLMVFFVLLFTMSAVDTQKLKHFQNALQSGLGVLEAGSEVSVGVVVPKLNRQDTAVEPDGRPEAYGPQSSDIQSSDPQEDDARQIRLEALTIRDRTQTNDDSPAGLSEGDGLSASLERLQQIAGISTVRRRSEVNITLEDRLLFALGSAEINSAAYPIMDQIVASLRDLACTIRIEGHTDDLPIHSGRFPSNWELSIKRAVNVVKYFVEVGRLSPARLSAVGYGESKPVVPNDTVRNRARNRRVEILLTMEEKG